MSRASKSKIESAVERNVHELPTMPSACFPVILRVGIQDAVIKEDKRGSTSRYWRLDTDGEFVRAGRS